MTAVTGSVALRLPKEWLELDPRVEDIAADLRRTAVEQWGDRVDLAVLDRIAAPVTAELRRLSAMADIVLAGCYTDVVEAAAGGEPLVLTANVLLAISPPVDGIAGIRRALSAKDDLEVTGVELAAGTAVLATGRIELNRPEWTEPVPALFHRYFIPFPGADRAAVLSFLTPNVDLADEFATIFRTIADTLAMTAGRPAAGQPGSGT
ncbi:hypothetical protein [Actinokineospora sp. NBRC 105648]|uniref:hypothetical protein n=1 Tax=Actinokineospora sp. NBRC 105648 TaxID=3032206 RepID=UPI0024A2C54B|nr:hypothetical protein [Actinokineospora sp. NBRC 105648]GLZ40602.1 hypothetical protein Acsp05_42260 [Actinokineospora sp. NBRC 105648]